MKISCSINSSKEWIVDVTHVAVACHAVIIILSRLRPLVASSGFKLFIVRSVVLVSLMRRSRINDDRWSGASMLEIVRATIILSDWGVPALSLVLVNMIVVSAVSVQYTLSGLPMTAHFIRLILNNARWIREVLYRMPLEGIGWVLQRWGISICIELRIALTRVKMKIGWLVANWGRNHLMISWWCDGLGMVGVWV